MFKRFLKTTAPLALACLGLVHGSASAAYPDRPIKMIVAYSAGGATDVTARAIAPFIEKYLGGGAR
ncbi:MAG: tripartite tricarboxylate transporter substrate binding protein, partial [Burkholderiaceae bacterium]|nr:tripartite tricarboxylate transporter substrate binding protein [Burkholderiaceae bacterium]